VLAVCGSLCASRWMGPWPMDGADIHGNIGTSRT
jgi:hypothetical protein